MVRADHTGNVKQGGVCVYFKESLPVRYLSNPYLNKGLIFEISINNKRGYEVSINNKRVYVVSIYRSLSQTSDDYNSFILH